MTDNNTNIGIDTTPTQSSVSDTLREQAKLCMGAGILLGGLAFVGGLLILGSSEEKTPGFIFLAMVICIVLFPFLGSIASTRLKALATITEAAQLYKDKHAPQTAKEQPKDTTDQQEQQ